VHNFGEAIQRIETLQAQEPVDMNPVCRLQFMSHDQPVEQAIVLVHGYTNCPQQFRQLGQRFFDLGYNVLIAPLPHHGLADRLADEQAQLTAEELVAYADKVVDIAQGLGEQITMVGISGGAVTTAWAAQNRSDLDFAVMISPAFGYQQVATPLTAPGTNLYRILPNLFRWWDDMLQAERGPAHCYPQYSTRALAEILRLGFAVQAAARREPPAAHAILVVTNANDTAVNPELTARVVKDWREHHADLKTYEFEGELQLPHDLIDPAQPDEQIDNVYPRLIDLITQ
jgi:carboxylesterase